MSNINFFTIPSGGGSNIRIEADKVEYFKANKHLTEIFLEDRRKLLGNEILLFFENQIESKRLQSNFIRVHDNCIVNILKVEKFTRTDLTLKSGTVIAMARRKAANVLIMLGKTRNTEEPTIYEIAFLLVDDRKMPVQKFSIQHPGKYLVGRKSTSKPCDIMIDTEDKALGRNHFIIEVSENQQGVHECILNLNKPAPINTTLVDKKKIQAEGKYFLKNKSLIQIGNTTIQFEIAR